MAITGDDNNNTLIGTSGDDYIYAYGGNDFLSGLGGKDYLVGGWGDDVLRSGAGSSDYVDGGDGIDTTDYTDSWTGVYVDLIGGTGAYGTAAGDYLANIENVNGSGYDDTLIGNAVANVLIGFDGTDRLDGREGNDTLYGLQGNDYLTGGAGADVLHGGIGIDTANYTNSAPVFGDIGVYVLLNQGIGLYGDAGGDQLYDIENVYGSNFKDVLVGDANANVLDGRGGNDTIAGLSGDDTLWGGAGDDNMAGGAGADTLDGESGINTVSYSGSLTSGVGVDLATGSGYGGEAEGDRLFHFANIEGSQFGDTLSGDAYANVIDGMDGDDTLSGRDGDDTLNGGFGNDRLSGGSKNDLLDGGAEVDTAVYKEKTASVTVTLNGATNATVSVGGVAEDTIRNIENVIGGSADDSLTGDSLANSLNGYSGNDQLKGAAGNDQLDGYSGVDTADYTDKTTSVAVTLNGATNATVSVGGVAEDTIRNIENVTGGSAGDSLTGDQLANGLQGGLGADALNGRLGADDLYAGADDVRDTFIYAGTADSGTTSTTWDQLFQFDRSQSTTDTTSDKIDLRLLDADPADGDQAFRFVTDFTSPKGKQADGQVRVVDTGSHMNVEIDVNGDNTADSIIQVMDVDTLTSRDFLL